MSTKIPIANICTAIKVCILIEFSVELVQYEQLVTLYFRAVSDAVLDACLAEDPLSKVACETACKVCYNPKFYNI